MSGREDEAEEDRFLSGVEEEGENEKAPSTWYKEVTFSSVHALYCGPLVRSDHCANVYESADDTLARSIKII